ncbi:hypothetical protein FNF29_00582 [Cafeteria roenbergensis]|uniref:COP9 signalosome complex subunit 4 n=1 Tax=Cafeteria roenbergensis TaxID=33653 RepID=A0A5A8DUA7_CAFRO|nr:hypothetical protein FNF29_00582 [Cafeteria roenbergensis]KAA0168308.1 hypothetical protein FNF28_02468 [Cafeteria roenbergensis]KAA0169072.1 hypothetical protein FNF31_00232 [Cafeteria roenbergensis]|eukprot:KAA0157230.1 hypothetical protein FNF29_00582 [Cafeteria roenbergensis]
MALASALDAAAAAEDQVSKVDKYRELVDSAVRSGDKKARLLAIARHAIENTVVGTVARPVCEYLASQVAEHVVDYDDLDPIGEALLEVLGPQGQAMAVADYTLRRALFDLYAANEDFEPAATVLSKCVSVPVAQRAATFAEIAQAFLMADNAGAAEMALRQVAELMADEDAVDKATQLRYRACRAQVADLQRNYKQAAATYSSLSQLEGDVKQAELEVFLDRAAVCAILDRAGPQRQRILNKIYRDPRAADLPSFVMLEKMCRQQLVRKEEADEFRATLRPHHLASVGDGSTVFDRAVREHNVLAASLVFTAISFSSLGDLLEVDAAAAEKYAARMVEEGRLQATIDQVQGVLEFGTGTADELSAWDTSLADLFGALTTAVDAISTAHPHLVDC